MCFLYFIGSVAGILVVELNNLIYKSEFFSSKKKENQMQENFKIN